MVRAGRVHRLAHEAATYGTRVADVRLDWSAVIARQRAIVAALQPPVDKLEGAGVRVHLGEVRFADDHTLAVGGARVRGERIIIAAGSEAVVPPIPGVSLAITSSELLFLPAFPERLVLIGAGAIGLEMASAFNHLGAAVTVIAQEPEIFPAVDADVGAYARTTLEARGVTFLLGARVTALGGRPGEVTIDVEVAGARRSLTASVVCLAAGRRWYPRSLGAESLGLETGRLGLKTSRYLRTSVPHIYAAGDAAGNAQLTPTAAYEGKLAVANALDGDRVASDLSIVPQAIFTTPEIARVGLTHREAMERNVGCHVSTHDMRGASNGVASGEEGGYLKLVFEPATERVLGVQMVSWAGAELIQLAALAIRGGATAGQLSTQLSVHPSHAERLIKVAAHEFHDVCEV
ncbi:MAG TPA: NAD(P)/FAD-dependent oxidoreductase [Methylomirabilota bacterium]|nr:NAD(P)/FAD-dependent oxidoreductase [Methylomirabilota bacterium]